MLSLDTECSGLDIRHGARPFFVTTCNHLGEQLYWEWDVDPLTREPEVVVDDLWEIEQLIQGEPDTLVLQNPKFDYAALDSLAGYGGWAWEEWDWSTVHDTLMAGHLLASNHRHDLTAMALEYLGEDIQPLEDALEVAVNEARRIAEREFPNWRIAKKGMADLPSQKESFWRADYWLPRAVAKAKDYPQDHPWWTVLSNYGNKDSETTLATFIVQKKELERRGLWEMYLFRMKLLPALYQMESCGVTGKVSHHQELLAAYKEDSKQARAKLVEIANSFDYDLELPKSGNNDSLRKFCFGTTGLEKCEACDGTGKTKEGRGKKRVEVECSKCFGEGVDPAGPQQWLGLPVVKTGKKSDGPALDKQCLEEYLVTLDQSSPQGIFTKTLKKMRTRDTALTYLDGYQRFWQIMDGTNVWGDWFRLFSSLNPTGSDTLRFTSSNPNAQNISKAEEPCPACDGDPDLRKSCEACKGTGTHSLSLRYCFGPLDDEEWWSLDYENIELRIPAYESREPAMIELFERPDNAPYFGSYHLLNASIVYPDLFWPTAEQKGAFKKKYASTWYQWCKNGGFCKQYGGGKTKTDATFHKVGAYDLLNSKMPLMAAMNTRWIEFANRHGYVETRADKEVCPDRGYPLLCARSDWGTISPTIPLNYHVQGTAMWCTCRAMVRCKEFLDKLSTNFNFLRQWVPTATREQMAKGYRMILQVHDEIVFKFPKGITPQQNLPIVRQLQKLMEHSGEDIGIPLRVAATYHDHTWAEGVAV